MATMAKMIRRSNTMISIRVSSNLPMDLALTFLIVVYDDFVLKYRRKGKHFYSSTLNTKGNLQDGLRN